MVNRAFRPSEPAIARRVACLSHRAASLYARIFLPPPHEPDPDTVASGIRGESMDDSVDVRCVLVPQQAHGSLVSLDRPANESGICFHGFHEVRYCES